MVDWLIIWGVTQGVGFVFKPILEDLAKDAAKDCIKDFFKTSLGNVIKDLTNKKPFCNRKKKLDWRSLLDLWWPF